jgi:hypothetical protein
MHLIIPPGNSPEYNEQWLKDSVKNYSDLFESTKTIIYEHWTKEMESYDREVEVQKLADAVADLDGNYVIFAKSLGTQITIQAVNEGKINPPKCFFVGSPLNDIDLGEYNIPTIFVQQTDDMFFKYVDLEKKLKDKNFKYELIEIPGENHAYDNYEELKEILKKLIEK